MTEISRLVDQRWDAIIIGTGMGGATLGYALARAGWRVLFCEKGKSNFQGCHALRGNFAETFFRGSETFRQKHSETLREAGRYFEELSDLSHAKPRRFIPFIGSGVGGSSALYGMALERFFPADFTPRMHHPAAVESTLPESWPISYAELSDYYAIAERIYGVRGDADPLRSIATPTYEKISPPFSPAAQELAEFFQQRGLHPYHLPLACDYVTDCIGCQGFLCARDCKIDSTRACLLPALKHHHATLIDECEALRLESENDTVTAVICRWRNREFRLKGRIIALAAGALVTPALLLRSTSPDWPRGLANASGLVGKNLMRHYVDLYAVFPKRHHAFSGNRKELGCNDFYLFGGKKFGSIQSFGDLPPAMMLLESMREDLRNGLGRGAAAAFAALKPLLAPFVHWLSSRTLVLATVMEDLPYCDNQVGLAEDAERTVELAITYKIRDEGRRRIAEFRKQMRGVLKSYRFVLLKQAECNQRLAHICGTCRFGSDPHQSVLDRNNKAHGLENLYVIDASFFPSSGGTNPALTVAANAFRVADHLVKQHPF